MEAGDTSYYLTSNLTSNLSDVYFVKLLKYTYFEQSSLDEA